MRKLLFALAMLVTGAFAFAGGSPASAMTAGPVTSLGDIVKPGSGIEKTTYYGDGYYYRRHRYYRPYYRPYYYRPYYYRPYYRGYYYRRHHYRPWW